MEYAYAVRRFTSAHGTTSYYVCRASDNLPITNGMGRPIAFVAAWAAGVWARNNGLLPIAPVARDVPSLAPEAIASYKADFTC